MSTSRRGRKIKPINPEEQPQISQFIVDSGHSPTTLINTDSVQTPTTSINVESKGKKRRRSTGGKSSLTKRRNPIPDLTAENTDIAKGSIDCSEATNSMTET